MITLRPRTHYTVFKRKRYCFVPFSKKLRPHLLFPYRFSPSTLQRVSVLKTLLNLILSYILPPFFLHYFPCDKLKLSHYAEVRPGLVHNHLGFGGLRPSRFILVPPEAGNVRSLTISCSFLEKSKSSLNRVKCASKCVKRLIITAINKDSVPHVGYSRLNGLQPSVVGSF